MSLSGSAIPLAHSFTENATLGLSVQRYTRRPQTLRGIVELHPARIVRDVMFHNVLWKSHKLKQGCTSTLAGEAKALSTSLGHLEWIICMFATVLFAAFCLENRNMYIRRFSAISVIDCKSVFDFVTKPGAPTGIDDNRCAIDSNHSRMPETDGGDSSLGTNGVDAWGRTD